MLINTSTTIAYKCTSCGSFDFVEISLFKLSANKEVAFSCRCNGSNAYICANDSGDYTLSFMCIGCGNFHRYILHKKVLLKRETVVIDCPETSLVLCVIGDDAQVRKKVDYLEKEMDELIDMFGYDHYFENTRVMYDALNYIHDLAERGNLFCECGSSDIELFPLQDRVYLRCRKCSGNKVISAASNEDLKIISKARQIIIPGKPILNNPNRKNTAIKTQRK